MSTRAKHLEELDIARDVHDPRRRMPPVPLAPVKVLDIGCGAGQTLIASQFCDGTTAVGVDCDLSALQLGIELSRSIQFICAAGEALPLRSDCFDLVLSRVAIPYMHVHSAVHEMSRVLRDGGQLWIVLHSASMTIKALGQALWRGDASGVVSTLYVLGNGCVSHVSSKEWRRPFKRGYGSFQTCRGIRRTLRQAGFDEIEIERRNGFVVRATKGRTGKCA